VAHVAYYILGFGLGFGFVASGKSQESGRSRPTGSWPADLAETVNVVHSKQFIISYIITF